MMSYVTPDKRTLQWVLRTQMGDGPLALLKLRGFTLPEQIFTVDAAATTQAISGDGEALNDIGSMEQP